MSIALVIVSKITRIYAEIIEWVRCLTWHAGLGERSDLHSLCFPASCDMCSRRTCTHEKMSLQTLNELDTIISWQFMHLIHPMRRTWHLISPLNAILTSPIGTNRSAYYCSCGSQSTRTATASFVYSGNSLTFTMRLARPAWPLPASVCTVANPKIFAAFDFGDFATWNIDNILDFFHDIKR